MHIYVLHSSVPMVAVRTVSSQEPRRLRNQADLCGDTDGP